MRKIAIAGASLALLGTFALATAPAEAAPEPRPTQPPASVMKQMPAPLKAASEQFGLPGWDDKGPYIVWGTMNCHLHLFVPEEWSWAFGTGPCWF
jgi:hypothetical protein